MSEIQVASSENLYKYMLKLVLASSTTNVSLNVSPELLTGFIHNPNPDTLYVARTARNDGDEAIESEAIEEYIVSPDLGSTDTGVSNVVILIKSRNKLQANLGFEDQINILNLTPLAHQQSQSQDSQKEELTAPTTNEYVEQLRLLISMGISPYFDLIANFKESSVQEHTQTGSINIARKKFQELLLSLQHLQQKIQVPNLLLSLHPQIRAMLDSQGEENWESVVVPETLIEDSLFLNETSNIVNAWLRQIQEITSLDHVPSDGETITNEINFWNSMESALVALKEQIESPGVQLTLSILNKAKRFHTTLAFANDSGITDKLMQAVLHNSILKDLPIVELNAITVLNTMTSPDPKIYLETWERIDHALNKLWNHIKKIRGLNLFPLSRFVEYIDVILNYDIVNKLSFVLTSFLLMSLSLEWFIEYQIDPVSKIISSTENHLKSMVNILRELVRKRADKFVSIKINTDKFSEFKERLENIKEFRFKHESMLSVANAVLNNPAYSQKLVDAYNRYITSINVLDLTRQGTFMWLNNKEMYMQAFQELESTLLKELNRLLDQCTSFNDFVSIEAKFAEVNIHLHNHEHTGNIDYESSSIINLAGDSYKLKILSVADREIQNLVLRKVHENSQLNAFLDSLLNIRNVEFGGLGEPSVATNVTWNLGLVEKVHFYLHHLETIIGLNWSKYSIGKKIQTEAASLLQSLNVESVISEWAVEVKKLQQGLLTVTGPLIRLIELPSNNDVDIHINIAANAVNLTRDTHRIVELGYKVPTELIVQAKRIDKLYPFIIRLNDDIKLFKRLMQHDCEPSNPLLKYDFFLQEKKLRIFELLYKLTTIDWLHISLAIDLMLVNQPEEQQHINKNLIEIQSLNKVKQFHIEMNEFNEKFVELRMFHRVLHFELYKALATCDHQSLTISEILSQIQVEFRKISLSESTSNISNLCDMINKDIEQILVKKCTVQLASFCRELTLSSDSNEEGSICHEVDRIIPLIQHSVTFDDQAIVISPPLESTKSFLFECLSEVVQTMELQTKIRIEGMRPELFDNLSHSREITDLTSKAIFRIESVCNEAFAYSHKWEIIQEAWELDLAEIDSIAILFGEDSADLEFWYYKVLEILKMRSIFDKPESFELIGNRVKVDISNVLSRASIKFDQFQLVLLRKFNLLSQDAIVAFERKLKEAQAKLEQRWDFEGSNITLILNMQHFYCLKKSLETWKKEFTCLQKYQKYLTKHRFNFPKKTIFVEQLEMSFSILESLMEKKMSIIDLNVELILSKVEASAITCNDSIEELSSKWTTRKPVSGNLIPSRAIGDLDVFRKQCQPLIESREAIIVIADCFDISVTISDNLLAVMSEIDDLRYVWVSINSLWEGLDRIKSFKWQDLQPRSLRVQLDDLLNNSRSIPTRVRQYSAFDEIQQVVKNHIKNFHFIQDLKSDWMKPRHWSLLFDQISPGKEISFNSLTVGDVWNLNLSLNEPIIKALVAQAANEYTLEFKLNSINEEWSSITFDVFIYKNKYTLVKNWNELFDKCDTDVNSLESMRNSPFFDTFEQEINKAHSGLSLLYTILDSWIEVQRQWVYLEGVFGNKENDIANILPLESTRFTNITYEFGNILKRIFKLKTVLDVVQITNLQDTMDKYLDTLAKVRRSLNEYLEKQRELFPRFYFIGNEDLLEIIGNASDINSLGPHLSKMFQGLAAVEYDSHTSSIIKILSPQGETVTLKNPISLIKYPQLISWLVALEHEIKVTLEDLTKIAIARFSKLYSSEETEKSEILDLIGQFPSQVNDLAIQINFTSSLELSMPLNTLSELRTTINRFIIQLTEELSTRREALERRKIEFIIIEIIHQRDIVQQLIAEPENMGLHWNIQQKFYYNPNSKLGDLQSVVMRQSHSLFNYGFEFQGAPDKLVYTPLMDQLFLTMTQALDMKLGGSPFGPAGTGKTESIKSLAHKLGRMVLVFNCDDSFDYQAMGRIFLGLCKVGGWGCFDEFNRLDERILSAVSSQVEAIENGLTNQSTRVEVSGKLIGVHEETGIFITMNPGYVGRVELPENLKKLFKSTSMIKPDKENIVEVLLIAQTFSFAKELSTKIVPFFTEIDSLTSNQKHYDFGLRSLKSTLSRSGAIKRANLEKATTIEAEEKVILRSIREMIAPKLVQEDTSIFTSLERKYFPNITVDGGDLSQFILKLEKSSELLNLTPSNIWTLKAIQLKQVLDSHTGTILVGVSGSGKTTVWKQTLQALSALDNAEAVQYVIDCKVMSKETLFGQLDVVTRDWSDGLFTSIIRKIGENIRGELNKRTWIIFDGDIDPEWAENLNSVLDDNKILTLPNGERLPITPNVRLLFEVDSLNYATPATVSRCGIVWFDSLLVPSYDMFHHLSSSISLLQLDFQDQFVTSKKLLEAQKKLDNGLMSLVNPQLLHLISESASSINHIMKFNMVRSFLTFASLFRSHLKRLVTYMLNNEGTPIDQEVYIAKAVLICIVWSFAGDCSLVDRQAFSARLLQFEAFAHVPPIESGTLLDYYISLPDCAWEHWSTKVPEVDLEPHMIISPNLVIPTIDTVRHEDLIHCILHDHRPLILCGPPGSGKTMTLLEVLRRSPNLDVVSLNFSKETSPISLLKSLEQRCEYHRTGSGITLGPKITGKWVVVFCDEINLPAPDNYGTQKVISFMRQMIEQKGFWRTRDKQWIKLENIQFVGACNPSTDPGRSPLSDRFLRHVTLIMVDYPGEKSLEQIYGTVNAGLMKCAPDLRGFTSSLTNAMMSVYHANKNHFTHLRSHYVYSPRELTRWSKGIYGPLKETEYRDLSKLLRLWYHEGLRLFCDRLVEEDERLWSRQKFEEIAATNFPNFSLTDVFNKPVLYSDWLSLVYESVDVREIKSFVSERLRVFSEEVIEAKLILHDDLLDYTLRIDRVLKQSLGHMILVGPCASGRSTLTKFVAWINGLKVFELKVKSNYGIEDFDNTLRHILLSCAKGEKLCFIIDEASILESAFIERMNSLLANAEIPGLFEGEELNTLMNVCLDQAQMQGYLLDTDDEIFSWFSKQISSNLHVVFTISETERTSNSTIISSRALFNRCVLSWMGNWSEKTLVDVAASSIEDIPLDLSTYKMPVTFKAQNDRHLVNLRDVTVECIIYMHKLSLNYGQFSLVDTPKKFITFINNVSKVFFQKLDGLENKYRHVNNGLNKLRETVIEVNTLKADLETKQTYLEAKDLEAKKMLTKMITDQNEAERKQEFSVSTQEELAKKDVEIQLRRQKVIKDLEKAEPAVLEAQRGVQNIKKQHLTEIRSMINPPAAVKMTMEAVCILLGYEVLSWRDVQQIVRREDFIANIVSFDNESQISPSLRSYMEKHYLSREDFVYEVVNRASKACGPLLQWIRAHLEFSSILEKIGPLKQEVVQLEGEITKTKAQLIAIDQMIKELEESIDKYKDDYSEVIRESEIIKSEMKSVENRVTRSMKLIESLTTERERWKESITKFKPERDNLIGNALLSGAMLTYFGLYDQQLRENLLHSWRKYLIKAGIGFNESFIPATYLTNESEIFTWEDNGVPNDSLSIDNFVIMSHSDCVIIVDPNSKVVDMLPHLVSPKTLVITSFNEDSYIKKVENALRFGGSILIKDAELYDPILNTILKKEIHRNGGRTMVELGEDLIDYSPEFKLFLHTKESSSPLSDFISSWSTPVNYTVTSGSLETQILSITLQKVKPDVEKSRLQLISSLNAYLAQLHNLEEELLTSLSDSSGKLLENDDIIESLETLKLESTEIDNKIAETSVVIETVESVRNTYSEVAKHSSTIYKFLSQLLQLNPLYAVSYQKFISIYESVLESRKQDLEIDKLIKCYYKEIYARIGPQLKNIHKVLLAIALAIEFYNLEIGSQVRDVFKLVLEGVLGQENNDGMQKALERLLVQYERDSDIGKQIPILQKANPDNLALQTVGDLISALDSKEKGVKFLDAIPKVSSFLFGTQGIFSSDYDLRELIMLEDSQKPFILAYPEGYDATYRVEQIAKDMSKKVAVISLGSREGMDSANKELALAMTNGIWLIIQNVQMSPTWLSEFSKRLATSDFLHFLKRHHDFKLFLTCATSSHITEWLVGCLNVITLETQPSLLGNFIENITSISTELILQLPGEFLHVCFLLAWYHALIQERLRFVPISFSKQYSVNDVDFQSGVRIISHIFSQFKGDIRKTNIAPESIPWNEIAYMVGIITYGSKVEVDEDRRYFVELANQLFCLESFDVDFNLVGAGLEGPPLRKPEGITIDTYYEWAKSLPEQTPAYWIGLEEHANTLLREKEGLMCAQGLLELMY